MRSVLVAATSKYGAQRKCYAVAPIPQANIALAFLLQICPQSVLLFTTVHYKFHVAFTVLCAATELSRLPSTQHGVMEV
jgi:hypothetical protein